MRGNIISFQGSTFNRQVEMLGDVEKITWFQCFEKNQGFDAEIYDQELALILEEIYEDICFRMITPQLFFI